MPKLFHRQVDIDCLTHRLRRRGALRKANPKAVLCTSTAQKKSWTFLQTACTSGLGILHMLGDFLIITALNTLVCRLSDMASTPRAGDPGIAPSSHRLVGLVVKASASRAEDPGFESCLRRDFFGFESYR